jgi:catechol 2,3-dioxygenase-like lactoylglutathione lyase family enzyme
MAPLVTAMACMTIAAPRPERLVALVRDVFGWEVRAEGVLDRAVTDVWGIAPDSAGERFTLLCSPGSDRGMIRVVRGPDRYPARQMSARWSGVEIVVKNDLEGLFRVLDAHPDFRTLKAPKTVDFTAEGANVHQYISGRTPGGTHVMLTMAVTPARDHTFPEAPARVGYIFSIPLVSGDFPRSRAFYRGTLRMEPVFVAHLEEGSWHDAWKLPAGASVDVEILKGDAPDFGLGGIELQGYSRAYIDPAPWQRDRLDGGTCLASYTVKDLDAAYAVLTGAGAATVLGPPARIAAAPYGGGRVFAFLGPEGERMELCERFS